VDKKIVHFQPDRANDMVWESMPGDFFYIKDEAWIKENAKYIDDFLHAMSRAKIIMGSCWFAPQGLYIDARPPTHNS